MLHSHLITSLACGRLPIRPGMTGILDCLLSAEVLVSDDADIEGLWGRFLLQQQDQKSARALSGLALSMIWTLIRLLR